MKKKFLAIMATVMSVFITTSALSGCKLVTVDNERDMARVVATVQIANYPEKEEIKKQDMVMAYLNYGYMYEQYYGYTREKVFTLILDSLVQNRVYVQNALYEFDKGDAPFENSVEDSSITDKWDVRRYLNAEEIEDATYTTYKAMNDLIDSYVDKEDVTLKGDAMTAEVRAVPTNAQNKEKDVDKTAYVAEGIDTDSTAERRNAYNNVIKLFDVNGLLGDYDAKTGDIKTTDYYKKNLKNNLETALLKKYETKIKTAERAKIGYTDLETAYAKEFNKQAEWSNADFVSALGSATASTPIIYGYNGNYGYVYNLLIGASTEQTALINAIGTTNKTERAVERRTILDATKVIDQRSTWILSGYDFDLDTKKFTGDYAFLSDSLPFYGQVKKLADATDTESAQYSVTSLDKIGLVDFVDLFENYLYGSAQTAIADDNASVYKKVAVANKVDNYEEKINELLFAFSTDPGSLNTFKGYAIKPAPDGANSEEYMQEFADAGRELLTMGGSSYIMVATDYGYHVMFFSEVFNNEFTKETLDEYVGSDWKTELDNIKANFDDYEDTESYLYLLYNSLASTKADKAVKDKQTAIINASIYDSETKGVTYFKDVYADLMK